MTSMYVELRLLIDGVATNKVPFSDVAAGQFDTDPALTYDPITGTLTAPFFSGGFIAGADIFFSKNINHTICVLPSDPTLPGGDLAICGGDGGAANALAPGGQGGDNTISGGSGGDASVAQAAGDGGATGIPATARGGAGTLTQPAGKGGDVFLLASNGGLGLYSGGGGDGGAILIAGGAGDSALNSGGAIIALAGQGGSADALAAGGIGARITLQGGQGGAGSAAQLAGVGGDARLIGGRGGISGGFGGNTGGNVVVDGGVGTTGPDGAVVIGGTAAESVSLGRAGKLTTVNGSLKNIQGLYGHDVVKTFADSGYVSLSTDDKILWNTAVGVCVQNLPAIATVRNQILEIIKTTADGNAVNITPNGLETINAGGGGVALPLPGGATRAARVYAPSAGTNWVVL